MEQVTIVGTEENLLILATESGARFSLPIDEVLRREIRKSQRQQDSDTAHPPVSPREIQSQIRAGHTAEEVAALVGATLDVVKRFEGPVLAEREHIIGQALAVPVLIGSEVEPDAQPTFGTAVRDKLADLGAESERWASWKDESGWIIKLEFSANEVDHDARWSFDPRRSVLSPLNADATQLSRQGPLPEGLIPRLRAVESTRPESPYKDSTSFDQGAFGPRAVPAPESDVEDPLIPERAPSAVQEAAIKRAPESNATNPDTADLLEALRRRRGQRESAPLISEDETVPHRDTPIALFEGFGAAESEPEEQPASSEADESSNDSGNRRKRRNAMPSWDEIVFGARTDD